MKLYIHTLLVLLFVLVFKPACSQVKDTSVAVYTAGSVTAVSPNVVYRIQIATVNNKAKIVPILKHYGITEQPLLENENTTAIRVMIGNYPNYSSAKTRADELKRKGLKAAFVAPYYKGERVSLQEAAMHSQE